MVRKSETMAFRKSRSATAMRINPFTDGLKGEGPSARALTPSVLRAMPVRRTSAQNDAFSVGDTAASAWIC